jgi:hypothetical protein
VAQVWQLVAEVQAWQLLMQLRHELPERKYCATQLLQRTAEAQVLQGEVHATAVVAPLS